MPVGRGVDEPVGVLELVERAGARAEPVGERGGARGVGVDDHELLRAQTQRGVRDGGAGAAGAEHDDLAERAHPGGRGVKLSANPLASVLWPIARPSSNTTVLTASSAAASGESSSSSATTSCLHGCVTFSPL